MRFDFAIMNPPYANHIGERLLVKTLEISSRVITIQPAAWLFGKRQNKNITKYADANGMEMTTISAVEATNAFAGTAFGNSVGIAYFGTNDGILYNGKKYNKCEDISFISDDPLLLEFKRIKNIILQNEKHNMETYMRREPNTLTFVNVPIEFSPNPNWWCMRVRSMIGNPGKIDFYTALSKDFKEQIGTYAEMSLKIFKMTNKGKDIAQEKKYMEYYYAFDDERTLLNLINYIQTDFFRGCLYIIKTSLHIDRGELRSIPWFDFTDPVFSKTPKEIDDYLFAKYGISNEIRRHIEELLPDYYGIRK